MKFEELGLHEDLLTAISYMGFETATPIQEQAIPKIIEGRDIIACAQTGTGKTAAFLLPVLHELLQERKDHLRVLILVPTRELAIQIDQQIEALTFDSDLSSLPIYGGGDGSQYHRQKDVLSTGADIVVATPGKLISHINMGHVNFKDLEYLILDEADRMLDIGFYDDIVKIISHIPKTRQSLMFSATMASKIKSLAKEILKDPFEISIAIAKPAEGIMQVAYLAYDRQKVELIQSLIVGKDKVESIIVFASTKKNVSEIVRALKRNDINAYGISSDLEQSEREKVLNKFRAKKIRVLVATDVISRGIDIKDIHLIINYNVPRDAADYVHRVGRTARADSTGVAITFINEDDMYSFSKIEKLIEKSIIKLQPPAEIGKGPQWKESGSGRGRRYGGRGRGKGKRNYSKGKRKSSHRRK